MRKTKNEAKERKRNCVKECERWMRFCLTGSHRAIEKESTGRRREMEKLRMVEAKLDEEHGECIHRRNGKMEQKILQ